MRTFKNRHPGQASGFTLVEMLVAIAIITILIGLLLTGLRAARGSARETQQLANARQLFLGWSTYSTQYDGNCLPGFLDTGVQNSWKVRYRLPGGQQVNPELSQTYVWRLAGFLDFNTELFLGYLSRSGELLAEGRFDDGSLPFALPPSLVNAATLPGAAAALQPEFGYNAYYLGGWWETVSNAPTMRFVDARNPSTNARIVPVARTIAAIARPDQMITFCASVFSDPGVIKDVPDTEPGAAWVTPPFLAQTPVWTIGPGGDTTSVTVLSPGAVPLRRYNSVVYATADGSQRKASYKELWDMSLWTNRADLSDPDRLQPVHTEN
ncbi:MAG: prepilin-type N-terminal cleavage/methylation domain-containing protein [Phycisphaeraceae bacterium]|nr:prepilin-type N-terminal cleavage/methylation domain-containing protein [Phycisphaeraceae bacterium]